MNIWINEWMNEWMKEWMNEWMNYTEEDLDHVAFSVGVVYSIWHL